MCITKFDKICNKKLILYSRGIYTKKIKKKLISILLVILTIISIGVNAYAHSGKTGSNGGHRDNKNKSGLGSYHYHCGGHQAHLHTNGVCPYSPSSSSSESSASFSSANVTATATVPATIEVIDIRINENIKDMEEGETKQLTATITPDDATDQNITWKSSDENIATVSKIGEIVAKKYGTVDITAFSSNGKTSKMKINVKEMPKIENGDIITESTDDNNVTNNITTENKDDSNIFSNIITFGLLGGGGYWGYKKFKGKNESR